MSIVTYFQRNLCNSRMIAFSDSLKDKCQTVEAQLEVTRHPAGLQKCCCCHAFPPAQAGIGFDPALSTGRPRLKNLP
jgi:hypothetical protein